MKSKNIIIFAVIIVAVFVGLGFFWSRDSGEAGKEVQAGSVSILNALERSFDFGTISMRDGNVSKTFELKNEGSDPILISKVYTSCMCTTAKVIMSGGKEVGPFGMPGHGGISRANIEVRAGETIRVEAIFNPAAHGPSGVGLAQRVIYLETNSGQTPKVELNFTATVTN